MKTFFLYVILMTGFTPSFFAKELPTEKYAPDPEEQKTWDELKSKGITQIIFVKRFTYNSDHYYTEYINSSWMPGGSLFTLNLDTGTVKDITPSLKGGVFGAFDLSFDAQKIIFAYKAAQFTGYKIYEINIDGTNLKQLTFDPVDEKEVADKYSMWGFYRGTEDLDPCYLPDGGIAFISTRCRHGILCDAADFLTTTVMHRMNADGSDIKQLSHSSLSENTPCVLPDGRIMYTRWEYVDKGAVAVKCLWSMLPDGSNSNEIYGNDIAFPTTMIMGRPIPGQKNEYIFMGTPHYPQNGVGTVVRVDVSKGTRTAEGMTYITPDVEIQEEGGFSFRNPEKPDEWIIDYDGKGTLFREAYPLNRSEFLVSHKKAGPHWNDPKAYQLYVLKEGGQVSPLYKDAEISCFRPIVLAPRKKAAIIPSKLVKELADKNLAECIVTNVYEGLEDIPQGKVKYIRVLEQIPRPWGARRLYKDIYADQYDQQHAVISKDTHLALKIQHGIVDVEKDGSARFLVPANKNIFFQVLDENFMALQTERTFVNYMPGEIRSCIGCHETNEKTPTVGQHKMPLAMKNKPQLPYAQPCDPQAKTTISYARDVQPVWDKHCISCHNDKKPPAGLNLTGTETALFNISYENLVPERRKGFIDRKLLGLVIGENHPKTANTHYLPAKSLGSHTSVLVAMLAKGKVTLDDPELNEKAKRLAEKHKNITLSPHELQKVCLWVDTNCQYYGSYYGRRNIHFKGHPDYRTEYSADEAASLYPIYQENEVEEESKKNQQ